MRPFVGTTNLVVRIFLAILDLVVDVWSFWYSRAVGWLYSKDERRTLHEQLSSATSVEEWQSIALRLDALEGNDLWRQNPVSSYYDYALIAQRFRQLITARRALSPASGSDPSAAIVELAELLRSGMLRNLGSLGSPSLYSHAYGGTKLLIEDYIGEVISCLEDLADPPQAQDASELLTRRMFFRDSRQTMGSTALILHGGSLFGICHIGVAKALLEAELLPHVVAGSTIGAIAAALIGSTPTSQLAEVIAEIPDELPKLWSLADSQIYANSASIVEGIIRSRVPPEIVLFERWVSRRLGNMTFEEAYQVSGNCILNILVLASSGQKNEKATVYNYLSMPKVVIKTAMRASIGSDVLPGLENIQLLAKDHLGRIVPYRHNPPVRKFLPANIAASSRTRDSPYNRLAEQFNVNNFVISVSRPYIAPLLLSEFQNRGHRRIWQRMLSLVRFSSQYRMGQLAEWGLLPRIVRKLFFDEIISGAHQVNVVPESESLISDVLLVLDSHNIRDKVAHWIEIGERGLWPQEAIIWVRTAIEYSLDVLYENILEGNQTT